MTNLNGKSTKIFIKGICTAIIQEINDIEEYGNKKYKKKLTQMLQNINQL
jgi:hypothetical protein